MLAALSPSAEQPSAETVERIQHRIASSLRPVRPLPTDAILTLVLAGAFVGLAVLGGAAFGSFAFPVLSWLKKVAYYGLILVIAVLLARMLVEQMIPGTQKIKNLGLLVIAALTSLIVFVILMFPNFNTSHFTSGESCLRVGCICTFVMGIVVFLFVQRGFIMSPLRTGIAAGLLSGLLGALVLALHCAYFNAPHILVWHFGSLLIGASAGAAAGLALHRLTKPIW
jgi:hypothetical protein